MNSPSAIVIALLTIAPALAAEPARIGSTRFHADSRIADARYGPGGKLVVGHSGGTIYVWDAQDGSLVRKFATGLTPVDDPTMRDERELAFTAHPKETRVACGGVKDGKTTLQVWDYATGKRLAEVVSPCDALKLLAWTPDGTRLLERANIGWQRATACQLIVRDAHLREVRAHDLGKDFGEWSTVMHPTPDGKQAILWQSAKEPVVFDLEKGSVVRTIPVGAGIPSDFGFAPDGKTLAVTGTEHMKLFDFGKGEEMRELPMLRSHWDKPRPLFSPDSATVYVWDHRPIAYDVATGKEKWKATFRSAHTVGLKLCDVSPDGNTVLARCGHSLVRIDAKTGTDRDPPGGPAGVSGGVWSPDGRKIFLRTERRDRTWTAWDASTGQRLFDLWPGDFAANDDWKMLPDLFFIAGGNEIVAGLEKTESTERSGSKELLVFDAATGKCVRRFGQPLPTEEFRWMHPVAVEPDGSTVVMQAYGISARPGPGGIAQFDHENEYKFETVRWDPVRGAKLGGWNVTGQRTEPPRHYSPYSVTIGAKFPDPNEVNKKHEPAKIRCYSLADGKLVHNMTGQFASLDPDRVQGNFLLTIGYDSKWVTRFNTMRYTPQTPVAYEVWELPARDRVRAFELEQVISVALGPAGRYVLRAGEDSVEVFEPYVLKKVVMTVRVPAKAERFEFAPDGGRVAVSLADASVVIWETTPWQAAVAAEVAKIVPKDVGPLWDELAKDATTGLKAARLLAAAGESAVVLLRAKVEPTKAPEAERVAQWIADLDSPKFAVREKAEKELRALAGQIEPHLRKVLKGTPSAEAKQRIASLLADIEAGKPTPEQNRELRAVQALKWIDTPAARGLLAEWAKGDANAPLTRAATGK